MICFGFTRIYFISLISSAEQSDDLHNSEVPQQTGSDGNNEPAEEFSDCMIKVPVEQQKALSKSLDDDDVTLGGEHLAVSEAPRDQDQLAQSRDVVRKLEEELQTLHSQLDLATSEMTLRKELCSELEVKVEELEVKVQQMEKEMCGAAEKISAAVVERRTLGWFFTKHYLSFVAPPPP